MMSDPKRVVYGINTGFGNFADKVITHDQRSLLQLNLVRSHAVGVGDPLPLKTVKKMTILRINTLAKGRSGIDSENLQRMIKAYSANLIPLIP
jgi:histidine ammonia-lyase